MLNVFEYCCSRNYGKEKMVKNLPIEYEEKNFLIIFIFLIVI